MKNGHRIISLCFGIACFTILAPTPVRAEPPSIEVKFAETPELPNRELTFVESEEEYETQLFAADPKLLEQKFVAVVSLKWPAIDRRNYLSRYVSGANADPIDLAKRRFWSTLVDPRSGSMGRSLGTANAVTVLKSLVEGASEELKQQPGVKALLDSNRIAVPGTGNSTRGFSPSSSSPMEITQTIHLMAPDRESAKQMALALLALYDQVLSTPIQKDAIKNMKERKAGLPELAKKYKEEEAKVKDLDTQVKTYEYITPETIADLKTQKRLIAVDMSGAEARVAACEKLLVKGAMSPKAREQVESIKITAEIDLVGLTAQKDSISQIIEDGNARFRLESRLASQTSSLNRAGKSISSELRHIASMEEDRALHRPLGVAENKIVIRPLSWISARSTSPFGR